MVHGNKSKPIKSKGEKKDRVRTVPPIEDHNKIINWRYKPPKNAVRCNILLYFKFISFSLFLIFFMNAPNLFLNFVMIILYYFFYISDSSVGYRILASLTRGLNFFFEFSN